LLTRNLENNTKRCVNDNRQSKIQYIHNPTYVHAVTMVPASLQFKMKQLLYRLCYMLIFTTVTVTPQHYKWCTLLRVPQASSKLSSLSICHTVPRNSRYCYIIYVPRKNIAFPDKSSTKLTHAQQRFVRYIMLKFVRTAE
jgi:hypothetical protein